MTEAESFADRRATERFRAMANSAPVLMWVAGPDKCCTWFNEPWLRFRGRDLADEVGDGWREGVHPDDLAACCAAYDAAFDAQVPLESEYRLRRADGAWRWVLDRGVPLVEDGVFAGYIGSAIDITERREAEDAVRRADRLKDEFLATLSHELRTPLNAIMGWAHILKDRTVADDVRRRAADAIYRNAGVQAQIVSDILDVSRIVTGKLRLHVRPTRLGAVLDNAIETVRLAIEAKDIKLRRDRMEGGELAIDADPDRLQQVVWNLLSNAVRFTPRGGILDVRLRVTAHDAEIVVADTGPGIDPAFLPYVFERFRQADGGSTRQHGGLGLGLAIVKHLVELHCGTITAENAPAGGAVFTVRFPVRLAVAPTTVSRWGPDDSGVWGRMARSLKGAQIVVVDDVEDAREMVATILTRGGAQVRVASSAPEALALVDAQVPDLVVTDLGMPGTDGHTLLAQLRQKGGAAADVPVIALTAHAELSDRLSALAAGFARYLTKPIEPTTLVGQVAEVLGR